MFLIPLLETRFQIKKILFKNWRRTFFDNDRVMIQNLKQPQNPQAGRAANLDYYPSTPYSAVAKDL
jgi:hypothetical protein